MEENSVTEKLTSAVELVSHETRAQTLVELATQHRESPRDPTMQFTELRKQVGHADPGNFNYHLKRLTGGLVIKTEAGYKLSDIGLRFVGILLSDRFDPDADIDIDTTISCPICARSATVAYEQGTIRAECGQGHSLRGDIGPGLVADRTVETALELAVSTGQFQTRLAIRGICHNCDGPISGELQPPVSKDEPITFVASCDRCGSFVQNTAGGCVFDHPAVVSLCYEHGIDTRTNRWALYEYVESTTVSERNPLRVEVEIAVEDERVVLVLSEDGTVETVRGR
jgi:hypothetical protein